MNMTLLVALILVVAVICLYLGRFADTIIPAVVIPMTLVGTFIVMDMFEFTLNNLSLLALTLAVGFVIDDAIVVLENIKRRQEAGEDRYTAAMEGARQIGFTIVSMTLSLIAVFLPMLLMGGLIGKIFKEFAITLVAATCISGVISLTLAPMLCSLFLPTLKEEEKTKRYKLFEWSHALNQKMRDSYGRMLNKVIDHSRTALAIGILCLVLTIGLFYSSGGFCTG
jgi:HAE1 family hydrophobic/amphiphilic exporter-1